MLDEVIVSHTKVLLVGVHDDSTSFGARPQVQTLFSRPQVLDRKLQFDDWRETTGPVEPPLSYFSRPLDSVGKVTRPKTHKTHFVSRWISTHPKIRKRGTEWTV